MAGEEAVTEQQPKAFVTFERTVQLAPFNTVKASIMLQFEPTLDGEDAGNKTYQAAHDAFTTAKTVVYDELGIDVEYDENRGVVKEIFGTVFGKGIEVVQENNGGGDPSAGQTIPATGTSTSGTGGSGSAPACPKCNGPMWDNRDSKKNPKAPDFKCRDKANCDGVIWPPKG